MAFFKRSLVLIASSPREDGSVSRIWGYSTADATATIVAAGYCNDARDRLSVGDLIMVTGGIGGTPVTLLLRLVAVPGTGNVTTTAVVTVT